MSHSVAVLAAGEQRVLEIELTARDAGNLTIQVEAKADGGAHVSLAEKLLVRRAGLQLAAAGPAVQYVGTPATYRLRCAIRAMHRPRTSRYW